ncbi:MAG: DUF4276 family protein [Gammaproteobacteria bacterium]|nr:DUF4276 family protein [Gammaproteobacteria bacterium]
MPSLSTVQPKLRSLLKIVSKFDSPELINDKTAPSKQIIKEIPEYEKMKASAGPIVAGKIGLSSLRLKCRHFSEWIDSLETLTPHNAPVYPPGPPLQNPA